jgi:hypothetical protein
MNVGHSKPTTCVSLPFAAVTTTVYVGGIAIVCCHHDHACVVWGLAQRKPLSACGMYAAAAAAAAAAARKPSAYMQLVMRK